MIRFFSILQSLIAASRIPAIDGDHPHVDCCTELILQKTTQYPEAQGNYILRPDLYAGFPVYAKMTGNYYIYMHETYQNWHLWTEIGSMYQRSMDMDTRVRGQPCPPLSADTDADTDI